MRARSLFPLLKARLYVNGVEQPTFLVTISSRDRAKDRLRCGLGLERSHTSLICASRNELGRVINSEYRLDLDCGLHDRVYCVCDSAE